MCGVMYSNQNNNLKSRPMESQQDTIDLTINDDDDDCPLPPELGEMVGSLLELDETVDSKETHKEKMMSSKKCLKKMTL